MPEDFNMEELIKRIEEEEEYVRNQTLSYQEYLPEFIAKAHEDLEVIETSSLELEKDNEDYDAINAVFRSFHNIKGSSGFVGQDNIQKIAHQTETLLDGCRKGEVAATERVIDLILKSTDIIKEILDNLDLNENEEYLEQVFVHIEDLEEEEKNSSKSVESQENQEDTSAEVLSTSNDFQDEVIELLDRVENNVLLLDNEDGKGKQAFTTILNDFRAIRCSAGFTGQEIIEYIAQKTEEFLTICKEKSIKTENIAYVITTSSEFIEKVNENNDITEEDEFNTQLKTYFQEIDDIEKSDKDPLSEDLQAKIPKLGEVLIQEQKLNEKDVKEIVEKQKTEYPDMKFGQIAVKEKKVKAKDVLSAVKTQKSNSVTEEYMRISTTRVDNLVDMVGELVITQSLVEQMAVSKLGGDNAFISNFNRMARTTKELQTLAMDIRMIPLKSTFQKITRVARDTINTLGKEVDFSVSGEDTEIDRIVTDKLMDPLVHLVKNAISHGIESPEEREKAGKPLKGKVTLNAYNKRGSIYIDVTDDGGGINTEKVYKKALDKELIDPNKEYTEKEIQEFIMLPGISTTDVANNVSGRGVGMDVVKTEIQKNGGKIEIKSEQGKGSVFSLKIPVNHAIMNGTVVDIEGTNYILPTLNVQQIIQPTEDQWIYVQNVRSRIKVREDIIPLVSISKYFDTGKEEEEPGLIVIIEVDQKYRALPVRNVIGRQEVVVKPAGQEFSNLKFVSGMSILGDGRVSLILDVENMFSEEGV